MTIKMIVRVAIVWAILTVTGCSASSEKTNDLYLIPEGYEGIAYAFYNVKNAPPLAKEGDYDVYLMNEKGYFVTSTPDMEYGRITDKYYYIDKQGQRKPIQDGCVRALGTGGFATSIGESKSIEIRYTGIEVTKTNCGKAFKEGENSTLAEDVNAVIDEILKEYEKASK